MDFHVLAIFLSIIIYDMTPEAFKEKWAKTIARLCAFFLFVWGDLCHSSALLRIGSSVCLFICHLACCR